MAVVGARELDLVASGGRARSRSTLIDASVPEEVMRTISADSTRCTTSAASSTSATVGAPKLVPAAAAARTAETTSGCACPAISGPQDMTQST